MGIEGFVLTECHTIVAIWVESRLW